MVADQSGPPVSGVRRSLLSVAGFLCLLVSVRLTSSQDILPQQEPNQQPLQEEVAPASEPLEVDQPDQLSQDPDQAGTFSRTISFSRDREMELRLRGAQTAFLTGNSVDGVRILAEILALPEPHNIQVVATVRDVREEATRILRTGSEEIREQFRRETEVRAIGDLREALESHDPALLARVAARYPFTPTARECVETLATLFHDHGRYDGVIQSAQRWIERSPDPALAAQRSPQLVELWHAALQEAGAFAAATQLAQTYSILTTSDPFQSRQTPAVEAAAQVVEANVPATWDVASELPAPALLLLRGVINDLSRQGVPIHGMTIRPIILSDRVVWRSLTEIICIQRQSGEVLWRQPISDSLIDNIIQLSSNPDRMLPEKLKMQLGHRVLRNSILGRLTSDGERVYCIEQAPPTKPSSMPESAPNGVPPEPVELIPEMSVVAYSLADGTVQWKSHDIWGLENKGTFLFGPPVPQGKSLYSIVQKNEQLLLLQMDAATGRLDGASVLGDAPRLFQDRRRLTQACPIVWHDGMAICATGAGAVAAFDIFGGQLRWGFRHPRDDGEVSPGMPQPSMNRNDWRWLAGRPEPQLMILGTNLIYASPETNVIRCLGADEGELRWEIPITDAGTIVGGDNNRVIIVGREVARSMRLLDGSLEREYASPITIASATQFASTTRLVLYDGQQIDWNPASGESTTTAGWGAVEPALAPAGSLLRVQGPVELDLFRAEVFEGNQLCSRVDQLSMRPATARIPSGRLAPLLPAELEWNSRDPQAWMRELTGWVTDVADAERVARVEAGLAELARSLESRRGHALPIDEWLTQWSLTPQQTREVAYRRMRRALADGQTSIALQHLFHLLEMKPEEWEVELRTSRFRERPPTHERETPRTVRLDAVLRGAMQELWNDATPEQRTEIQAAFATWSTLPQTQLDDLSRPLALLNFLPQKSLEKPFRWTPLAALAMQQLDLLRRVDQDQQPAAAAALWRLAELHMARGDWSDAARLIEQLRRRFGDTAIRGDQTTQDLVKSLPVESPVLKRIDQDRRTAWPDREPVVTTKDSFLSPDQQVAVPIQAERGSMFDHVNVTSSAMGPSQLRFSGLGKGRSWTLSLPKGARDRNHRQFSPELRRGWAFGQFVVVQVGTELFCVSSLNTKGETSTVMKREESILWPPAPSEKGKPGVMVDTLGDVENALLALETRPVPQMIGFIRPETEQVDVHGHRATWVGPVNAGTLCFLQQGMLVCLETATGKELWRRYDMPAGVRTVGDDGVIALLHDGDSTIDLLSPVDGRTVRSYRSEHRSEEYLKHWGRMALVATGQPARGTQLSLPSNPSPAPQPAISQVASARELFLKVVDLAGPLTVWERTYPAGSAAFEVDEDWVGVVTSGGVLQFIDRHTGQTISETSIEIPPAMTQVVTAVTERTIYVSLSPDVTEKRLVDTKQPQNGWRRPFVNGPVLAFDRLSGKLQWTQMIQNRVLPLDQVRDIPLLLCVDVWEGSEDPLPAESEQPKKDRNFFKPPPASYLGDHSRYWCLDARTGNVVLATLTGKGTRPGLHHYSGLPQFTIERDLEQKWVELRVGRQSLGCVNYRFNYSPVEPAAK